MMTSIQNDRMPYMSKNKLRSKQNDDLKNVQIKNNTPIIN